MQKGTGVMHLNTVGECGRYFSIISAGDYVLATGETHTVREFTNLTFQNLGIELEWSGKGEDEKGKIKSIDLKKAKSLIDYSSKKDLYSFDFTTKLKAGDVLVAD